ncbi:DUF1003 domain-containing protein [Catenulispora sp. NF23]|uniref:DUF1003 domain-containing protein n=1 Tax=Catenulispora pinistramenti TaxID=2705254 RepID=A0ABS5L3V3_9ACTN|nr:DUF1003 domain-containing protein [Catenulispora pinistramenti]MBS2536624.1 DUF1003 domain-containing protein [Catenulispora pinistramenti]MBS2552999.1 DUF1003 domain-containing protein [Catenulispora pinistramenti]
MTAQAQLKSTVKSAVRHIAPGSWRRHPGVRTGEQLTRGERAADAMRNSMGSWMFVFVSVCFLIVWMTANVVLDKSTGHTFDAYPFILLNLVLSCVAALQGAILLIAAKRSDQVASELAQHDYEEDCQSREMLQVLTEEFAALRSQHAEQSRQLAELIARLPQQQ